MVHTKRSDCGAVGRSLRYLVSRSLTTRNYGSVIALRQGREVSCSTDEKTWSGIDGAVHAAATLTSGCRYCLTPRRTAETRSGTPVGIAEIVSDARKGKGLIPSVSLLHRSALAQIELTQQYEHNQPPKEAVA